MKMRKMSVSADVNQLYGLSKSEDDMNIDYKEVRLGLLDAQRESYRRERRQETKFDEINRRFMTLASAISSPHPTEILAGCGTQELKYENNVLKATIKFEIHLPQKSVSIDIQISVPEGEAVDPELRFVNIGGHAITLSCNKDSEEMIIEELRCLMMRSDKMIFSL
jgi:hypothetical protein